jgi:hypothetical protein
MFKSICEEAYTKVESDIKKCLTPTRCKGLIACINDVEMPQEKFESFRTVIINAFEKLFPAKSKFEKQVPTGTHKKAPALAPGLFCRKGQKECP